MLTASHAEACRPAFESEERQKLLIENLLEVRYIARRIHGCLPPHVPFDDLVHAGILGLIDAVDRFDPRKNVQLSSYARFRIRGAILDSLRQMDWGPRSLRRKSRQLDQAQRDLALEFGRAPVETELAACLGITLLEFQHLRAELRGLDMDSLHLPSSDAGSCAPSLPPASRADDDPFQLCLRSEIRTFLAQAIAELDDQERQVLGKYYLEELTMKEVGALLDVGESRISQIHTAALIQLRARLLHRLGGTAAAQPVRFREPAPKLY